MRLIVNIRCRVTVVCFLLPCILFLSACEGLIYTRSTLYPCILCSEETESFREVSIGDDYICYSCVRKLDDLTHCKHCNRIIDVVSNLMNNYGSKLCSECLPQWGRLCFAPECGITVYKKELVEIPITTEISLWYCNSCIKNYLDRESIEIEIINENFSVVYPKYAIP